MEDTRLTCQSPFCARLSLFVPSSLQHLSTREQATSITVCSATSLHCSSVSSPGPDTQCAQSLEHVQTKIYKRERCSFSGPAASRSLNCAAVPSEASPGSILALCPLTPGRQLAAEDKRLPRLEPSRVSSDCWAVGSLAWVVLTSSGRLQAPAYRATACIHTFYWAGQRKSRHPSVSR